MKNNAINTISRVQLHGRAIDIESIVLDGINREDCPHFCDAFISEAQFENGKNLTDEQCEELTHYSLEYINAAAMDSLF